MQIQWPLLRRQRLLKTPGHLLESRDHDFDRLASRRVEAQRISLRKQIAFHGNGTLIKLVHDFHGGSRGLQKIPSLSESLLFPFLRYGLGSEAFRNREFVQNDRTAGQSANHFRNRHRAVEQVFAGLKLVSRTRIKDVRQSSISIGDNLFVFKKSNNSAGAE